jgi:hypothetical protein
MLVYYFISPLLLATRRFFPIPGRDASDLLYHLIVLLTSKGLRIEDVVKELQMRHDPEWDKKRRVAKSKGEMK